MLLLRINYCSTMLLSTGERRVNYSKIGNILIVKSKLFRCISYKVVVNGARMIFLSSTRDALSLVILVPSSCIPAHRLLLDAHRTASHIINYLPILISLSTKSDSYSWLVIRRPWSPVCCPPRRTFQAWIVLSRRLYLYNNNTYTRKVQKVHHLPYRLFEMRSNFSHAFLPRSQKADTLCKMHIKAPKKGAHKRNKHNFFFSKLN